MNLLTDTPSVVIPADSLPGFPKIQNSTAMCCAVSGNCINSAPQMLHDLTHILTYVTQTLLCRA